MVNSQKSMSIQAIKMSSRCVVHLANLMSDMMNYQQEYQQPKQILQEVTRSRIRKCASSQEPTSPDQVQPWPEEAKPKVEMPV
jgi:hypothetical protein